MDHPAAWHRRDAGFDKVGAGDDTKHAGHCECGTGIDACDIGVCVGRADEHGVGLGGQDYVIDIPTAAADEAAILDPANGAPETARCRGRHADFCKSVAPAIIAVTIFW
jgi:hypothetical protein